MNMIRPVSDLRIILRTFQRRCMKRLNLFFDKEWLWRYGCSEHGGV